MNIAFLIYFSLFTLHSTISLASDWPTFQGGDLRKGASDGPFAVPGRTTWVLDTRENRPPSYKPIEFSVPVTAGDGVFVGTSQKIFYRLSARDGAISWSFKTAGTVESTASVDGDSVFFGDGSGTFYALDAKTGKLLWSHETKGEILSSPLVAGGIAYVTNASMEVSAFDALTGKRLWSYKRPAARGISIRGGSSPSYDGTRLYIGFSDGFAVALNPQDGSLIWEKRLADAKRQLKDVDASPVPDGDSLYISFYDGSLYSLNAADGSINWKFEEGGAGSLAVTDNAVYLPSSKGAVHSVDKRSGRLIWSHQLENGVPSSIIAVGGYLLFGLSTNGVTALDMEKGDEKWRYAPGSGVYGGLAYSNGNLYFLSNGGSIYAIPSK